MTALLRKDFYAVGRYSFTLMSLALISNLFSTVIPFGDTYALLMAFIVPLSSITADEKCKWDRFAAMLPYRVEQIVWSKYLFSYLYTLIGAGIMVFGALVRSIQEPGTAKWGETAGTIFMMLLVMLFVTVIGLPLVYRFGSGIGRLAVLILVASGVSIAVAVLDVLPSAVSSVTFPLALLAATAAAGAMYLSFRLSVRFYRRRREGAYQ